MHSAASPLEGDDSLLIMPRRASTLSRSNMQSLLWAWESWASPGTCSPHNHRQPCKSFTVKILLFHLYPSFWQSLKCWCPE